MTDEQSRDIEQAGPTSTVYRPAGEGGLEPSKEEGDYRDQLRSRRWNAAPLENPEAEKTDPRIAVAAIAALSLLTLVVLIVGYGVGLWSLPA